MKKLRRLNRILSTVSKFYGLTSKEVQDKNRQTYISRTRQIFYYITLKDVLEDVGIKSDAVYIGYYGKDTHLSGDPDKVVISRGVPIKKALEDEALISWSINGEDLPVMNGYPLRLVFGGWPCLRAIE